MNNNKNTEVNEKVTKLPSRRINRICFLFCLGMGIASFFVDFNVIGVLYLVFTYIGSMVELFILGLRFSFASGFKFADRFSVKGFFSFILHYFVNALETQCVVGGFYSIFVLINSGITIICTFLPVPFLFYLPIAASLFATEDFFTVKLFTAYFWFSMLVVIGLFVLCIAVSLCS